MAQIQQEDRVNLNAKKFNMWIFIFTSFMFFAALTSGFIVYAGGKGFALQFKLPSVFIYSTAVIVLSSLTLFLAARAARQLRIESQRLFLWITIGLGVVFGVLQFYGWVALVNMQIYFVNPNASRSFVYVFTLAHLIHILAGVLLLLNTLVKSYRGETQTKNLYHMQMSSIFWHFVDIIWIYLYVFLLLNQN